MVIPISPDDALVPFAHGVECIAFVLCSPYVGRVLSVR